jgi:hypothetical protein
MITARDVLNRRVATARLFQLPQAKQFCHRSLSSRVIGSKSSTLTRMPKKIGFHKGLLAKPRVHQHYDIVAHSALDADAHGSQTAALAVGNNNVALCPFARLL